MAIITCTNPNAGTDYDPNRWSCDEAALAEHVGLAHETTYEGCVLRTGEHNFYDDSDFYAMVWDEKTESVIKITYGTTRGWTYHNSAAVDATAEVREKAEAWEAERLTALYTEERKAEKLKALKALDQGVEVKSLTTRGKNKGVVGYVQRVMKSSYAPGDVVGVQVEGEDKLRWLDTERVERTDFPADEAALRLALVLTSEEAAQVARHARANAVRHLSN